MKTNLADFFAKVASQASLFNEPVVAHLCRMTALAVGETSVRLPPAWGSIIGVWDWDVANDRNRADPDCAALFGLNPAKAAAGLALDRYLDAVHPDDVDGLSSKIQSALKAGGVLQAEYRIVMGNEVRWVFARGYCTLDRSNRPERLPGAIVEL